MIEQTSTIAEPLVGKIRRAVERGEIHLPPLPQVVSQIEGLLADGSQASTKRIAELIRSEPAMAATVLRMANSAAFGGLHRISDLSHAVARLGFRQVSSVVTALAHSGHFRSKDPGMEPMLKTLWGHAVSTALGAKRLAESMSADPEESFIAGLLHDTGKLLVLKAVDCIESEKKPSNVTPAVLDELMDTLHTELGHQTLVSWHLPEPICQVALRHHEEELDFEEMLTIRVQVADGITRKIGEHPKPEPDLDLLELRSVELLNLSDLELASLIVDLEDEVAEVKRLL